MSSRRRKNIAAHRKTFDSQSAGISSFGPPVGQGSRLQIYTACIFIVFTALAAYLHSFSVPFLYDDEGSILKNTTIRHLWPIWDALSPPHASGETVGGRPMLNLSLAVNYAVSGTAVWSYHALNFIIQILAGLALFGIVRRTLLRPVLRERFGQVAWLLALAVALIWTVHPLQTESVTYIVQRAESLMGLFYLLTVYCFVRGMESRKPGGWLVLATVACLLGMASKEVMVSAPLMVLLYDRTFVAGTFRKAWQLRWRFYSGLAGTWFVLGCLVAGTGGRGSTAGFSSGVAWWAYALTQFRAITHYLWLSVWPQNLIFNYGTDLATPGVEVVPYVLLVALLFAGTLIALRRWPAIGFLGAWFFLILAPSSSVVPVATEIMAEHRMYLALAPVVVLVVLGLYRLAGKQSMTVFLTSALVLAWLTFQRNESYRSELAIWSDTVAKCPNNARAQYNLGHALFDNGQTDEAMAHYQTAIKIQPDYAEAHNNLGYSLLQKGQIDEAITHFQTAIKIHPDYADAHDNLGGALLQNGQVDEAIIQFQKTLALQPDDDVADFNLGNALVQKGQVTEAIARYQMAIKIRPGFAEAHNNLGIAFFQKGQVDEEIVQFQAAIIINPDYAEAHNNLACAFLQKKQLDEAITQSREALRIRPDYAGAHKNLGLALVQKGQVGEAVNEFQRALAIQPGLMEAQVDLARIAWILATSPDSSVRNGNKAVELAREADQLSGGNNPMMAATLAAAYAEAGRFPEAITNARRALQLAMAQNNPAEATAFQAQLKMYQSGSPFRDAGSTP